MKVPHVRTAAAHDDARVIDTIVLAFAADPIARWCWPEPHSYINNMAPFTRAFGGGALQHGTAYCTDDYGGASLWLPPGTHADEEVLSEIVERTVSASIRGDLFQMLEQMAICHPREAHWYLPMIGVDPACQGKGYGSALLSFALEQCDRDRCPAYLESTNPRNISLYERHGFEAVGRIQVGTSPPMVPMVRRPGYR